MRWALICLALLVPGVASARGGIVRGGAASNPGIVYPWRFGILSDTHCGWAFGTCGGIRNLPPLRACVDTLNALHVDFAILNGDWGGGYATVTHQANIDSLYAVFLNRATFPVFPVLGNHEAISSDTLTTGQNPYASAIARFPQYFVGRNYYLQDWKNVRFVATQTNVDYDVSSPDDYRVNNPTYGGSVPRYDWDGMHSAAGAQRAWLGASALRGRDKSHWLIFGGHRGIYGSSANDPARHKYNAGRSGRYVKQAEDSLTVGERGLMISGDQHIPVWLTKAIADSAVVGATAKGFYHMIVASGSGARAADSTEVFGGPGLQAFAYYDQTTRNRGRTSQGWLESMTVANDPGLPCQFTWALCTVWGDLIQIEFFRTYTSASAGSTGYPGANRHRLISRHTLSRDVG